LGTTIDYLDRLGLMVALHLQDLSEQGQAATVELEDLPTCTLDRDGFGGAWDEVSNPVRQDLLHVLPAALGGHQRRPAHLDAPLQSLGSQPVHDLPGAEEGT
jgi:hypothetical protein